MVHNNGIIILDNPHHETVLVAGQIQRRGRVEVAAADAAQEGADPRRRDAAEALLSAGHQRWAP